MNAKKTAIAVLDDALDNHPFRPKGIKVGPELWKALHGEGRITTKPGKLTCRSAPDAKEEVYSGLDFPFINDDIHITPDLSLDDFGYALPRSA